MSSAISCASRRSAAAARVTHRDIAGRVRRGRRRRVGVQTMQLYFTIGNGPLWRVSAEGGDPGSRDRYRARHARLSRRDDRRRPAAVDLAPHQQSALDRHASRTARARSLFGPVPQVIRHAAYSRSGHLVYQRVDSNPGIWAMRGGSAHAAARVASRSSSRRRPAPERGRRRHARLRHRRKWGQVRLSFRRSQRHSGERCRRAARGHSAIRRCRRRAIVLRVVAPAGERDDIWTIDITSRDHAAQLTSTGVRGDPAWDPTACADAVQLRRDRPRRRRVRGVASDGIGEPVRDRAGREPARFLAGWASRLAYILLDPKTRTDVWTRRSTVVAAAVDPPVAGVRFRPADFAGRSAGSPMRRAKLGQPAGIRGRLSRAAAALAGVAASGAQADVEPARRRAVLPRRRRPAARR